jgi:ADP-dependent NAD(P)H-hydrate dehydratase / NAD(P)H-hydrate epimerase
MTAPSQILTLAQMRAAEQALIDGGLPVEALMDAAGGGAAEWVWRIAPGGAVTVLCGPGNNGGDGYVLAEAIRRRGGAVSVIAALEPKSAACRNARSLFGGTVHGSNADLSGEVFVDCLFGSGLTRALAPEHAALLRRLASSHRLSVAVDLPSGIETDSGAMLGEGLPRYDVTLALGAWKPAHVLMPGFARMGARRLVEIGIAKVPGAARMIGRPEIAPPPADAHKYSRGLLAVVGGGMPGASVMAAIAAQGAGAGYVKLLAGQGGEVPHDLVAVSGPLTDALPDRRLSAVLIGPGLGRDRDAGERLACALAQPGPLVLDADALVLLGPAMLASRDEPVVATPHEGELAALERAFGLDGHGSRIERASELAQGSGMTVIAKGPDTVVAAPDGRIACHAGASVWLSTAGTGDVLAGITASRIATGAGPFDSACDAVWLHAEAARLCDPAFTAMELARKVPLALEACL